MIHVNRADEAASGQDHARRAELLCLCADHADPDALEDFRRRHDISVADPRSWQGTPRIAAPRTPPSPGGGSPPVSLEAAIGHPRDFRGLRVRLRAVATAAGFRGHDLHRAVLAVHEASVVAWELTHPPSEGGPEAIRGSSRRSPPCAVRVRHLGRRLVTDITLPRKTAFPGSLRDDDPQRTVRAFCREATWTGTLGTRHIHVVADLSVSSALDIPTASTVDANLEPGPSGSGSGSRVRVAEAGELCTCRRPASAVYLGGRFGDTGDCGLPDRGDPVDGVCVFCGDAIDHAHYAERERAAGRPAPYPHDRPQGGRCPLYRLRLAEPLPAVHPESVRRYRA